jgi:hypothetical protein
MQDTSTSRTDRRREVVHADGKVTGPQVWRIAHQLADIAGIDWPANRGAASALIAHLEEQRAAVSAATSTSDNIPF